MTTTYRDEVRGRTGENQQQQGSTSEGIQHPLLLAALLGQRRSEEGIQFPLLLAALMKRRGEEEGTQFPLLLAALMKRRGAEEGMGSIAPILFMMKRHQQVEEEVEPLVWASVLSGQNAQ
ncbi:MAG TPA: hypothetical protein VKV40_11705 [Ktedonobacteraceae bacterium]|nr:hypothetical protein [Ktedonobacteraceae bacterium]